MALLKKITLVCFLVTLFLGSCTDDEFEQNIIPGDIPEGYAMLDINLAVVSGKAFVTRADEEVDTLLTHIDDVHLLVFNDAHNDGIIEDTDSLVIRSFYEYGVKQNIYLKKGLTYFVYVVANLDDSNCPEGDVEAFFESVKTYSDMKEKYLRSSERSPRELGKMIMSTDGIIPIELKEGEQVFTPTILLHRVQSRFTVNIYNKVASQTDRTVISGVYPSTLGAVYLPDYSYVVERKVSDAYPNGTHDYPFTLPEISDGYYDSSADFLPAVEAVIQRNGNFYTRQTMEFFSFENRRGSVEDINNYTNDTVPNVPKVYGRNELAPEYSTFLRLTSLVEGNVLLIYAHAGKGRNTEDTSTPDDITNFDVDRSCVYNFNIYINGVNDVDIDTRRLYLDQLLLFTLPDMRRIDAHYMDIPSFILSTAPGYAKLQSGTCDINSSGNIIYSGLEPRNWRDMYDSDADSARWLRFSWRDPYNPSSRPINTSLYAGIVETDGVTGATPVLHFNEYVYDTQRASTPAVNPEKRTAVIRVGFVPDALSSAEYDQGVLDGKEAAFYVPVSQYGLKTIGQLGGYQDGVYTSLLGVESVEEYRLRYYTRDGYDQDVVNRGPYWRYVAGMVDHNQAYDGITATKDHYDEYRGLFANNVPPVRWDPVGGEKYNPFSNTNAADYCMRKNRDEDGNGIIEGDEIKWYLPTPVQVMQIYTWRDAFRGGSYTLNPDYTPFGTGETRYYWTTNEEMASGYVNAYVVDFAGAAAMVVAQPKTDRNPVRCVRDIPGTQGGMFYYDENGHVVVADLTGSFPNLATNKPNLSASDLRNPNNNTLAQKFLISRWYATGNANHTGEPGMVEGNSSPNCDNYSEDGYPAGRWFLPSQRELSLIYAYAGMIENILEQQFPGAPNTSTTYHTFREGPHWGITNTGSNNEYWNVDFATGAAQVLQKSKNRAYYRCVTYIPVQ